MVSVAQESTGLGEVSHSSCGESEYLPPGGRLAMLIGSGFQGGYMGSDARQGDPVITVAWRIAKAWVLVALGLVLMIGLILVPFAFVVYELMGLVVGHMS